MSISFGRVFFIFLRLWLNIVLIDSEKYLWSIILYLPIYYNKTIYYVNKRGDCSCQGYKVRKMCSHALAIDVFVRLLQMGCAENGES